MKKIISALAIIVTVFIQQVIAQETTSPSLQKTITSYLNVKNALTKDKTDSVMIYAKELSSQILTISDDSIPTAQRTIWKEYSKVLSDAATDISNTTGIKKQRKKFVDLSTNLYKMLKTINVNSVDLFYQYCPMADAYWLSEYSIIKNPYYGKQMFSCGSTTDTLKAHIQ